MKKIALLFLVVTLFVGFVSAQETSTEALPELSDLADKAARVIEDTIPPRLNGDSGVFYFKGITFNGGSSPLGGMLESMILNRALAMRIRNLSFWGLENPPNSVPDETGGDIFGLSGEIYRVGEELMISLRVFQQPNFMAIGGTEEVLTLSRDLLGLLGSASSSAGAGDFYEPNNDFGMATPYSLGETMSDLALASGDVDWFSIDLSSIELGDDMVYLTIGTGGNLDTKMALYGPDDAYVYIMENDDAEDSNARVQTIIESPGIYYVMVEGYDSSETGPYTLVGNIETMAPELGEPNNTPERAEEFSMDQRQLERRLFPSGDLDWYRFDFGNVALGDDEIIVVETNSNLDTYIELYQGDTYLSGDDDGGSDSNGKVEFQPDPYNPVYYVLVKGYDGETTGDYVVQFTRRTIQIDEYEPDNNMSEATPIEPNGRRQSHNFETPDEIDWYALEVIQDTNVVIESFGDTDTYIYLYDQYENSLAESDDDGSNYNGRITKLLSPGTYFFTVEPYSRDGDLNYEISVSSN